MNRFGSCCNISEFLNQLKIDNERQDVVNEWTNSLQNAFIIVLYNNSNKGEQFSQVYFAEKSLHFFPSVNSVYASS